MTAKKMTARLRKKKEISDTVSLISSDDRPYEEKENRDEDAIMPIVATDTEYRRYQRELPLQPPDKTNPREYFRVVALAAINAQLWEYDEAYIDLMKEALEDNNKKEYENRDAYEKACKAKHASLLAHRGRKKKGVTSKQSKAETSGKWPWYAAIVGVIMLGAWLIAGIWGFWINPLPMLSAYAQNRAEHLQDWGFVSTLLLFVSGIMLSFLFFNKRREAYKTMVSIREAKPKV